MTPSPVLSDDDDDSPRIAGGVGAGQGQGQGGLEIWPTPAGFAFYGLYPILIAAVSLFLPLPWPFSDFGG